jgi:hypothetical protein
MITTKLHLLVFVHIGARYLFFYCGLLQNIDALARAPCSPEYGIYLEVSVVLNVSNMSR